MDFIFKVMVQQSRILPSLIASMGGGYLPVSVHDLAVMIKLPEVTDTVDNIDDRTLLSLSVTV